MKLGILFSFGSSFKDYKRSGQDKRFVDYYLQKYRKKFKKVFLFSYKKETYSLPKNCFLVANETSLNRFVYSFLLPFLNWKTIKQIDLFRVLQLSGTIPAVLIRIFFNKPFVFTYGYDYSSFAFFQGQRIKPILLKILEKIAVSFSSGVVVTNKKIESRLRKDYPQANLIYLANGVNTYKFRPKIKRRIADKKITVLFVGRLEKQKNLSNLIKAVSLLSEKKKIRLLFIGRGKLKLQLIKLAEKLNVDLKIIDKISHQKINQFYQRADIFALPSFLEGHPKVLLEAMACGLACLVAKYAGAEEFKDKEEVSLTGFKAKQIADNLKKLISNKNLRKKLGQNARKKAVKDFDINNILEKEINWLKNA